MSRQFTVQFKRCSGRRLQCELSSLMRRGDAPGQRTAKQQRWATPCQGEPVNAWKDTKVEQPVSQIGAFKNPIVSAIQSAVADEDQLAGRFMGRCFCGDLCLGPSQR